MYYKSFTHALRGVAFVSLIILGGKGFAESTFWEIIANGTPSDVSSAIEAGADVNAPFGDDGWTPLEVALTYNTTLDVVRVLLEGGADAGGADQMQNTHLHTIVAMSYGESFDFELIDLLTSAGADINARNFHGETPLFNALVPALVEFLLESGAEIGIRTHAGRTALMRDIDRYRYPATIQALLAHGLDVNARSNYGRTALMFASGGDITLEIWDYEYYYNPGVIRVLVEAGADANAADDTGRTPLMYGAYNRVPEAVELLLAAGAHVDAVDETGQTALAIAARFNDNPEVVRLLLSSGADTSVRNDAGETPLEIARRYNNRPEIVELLAAPPRTPLRAPLRTP
jgi:uncharacterized protein